MAIQKANSKPILVKVFSPPPGCEIEIDEEVTARVFLEKVAPKLGLQKSDAPSLQMEFSETTLAHEQQLNTAGMCDESLCRVLGVEAALEMRKAKAIDIVEAALRRRMADVQLVCQYAPKKVNDQNLVLLLLHTHTLLIIAVAQYAETALHVAAQKNSLEVAEALVAAKANVDIKNKVRAGCS